MIDEIVKRVFDNGIFVAGKEVDRFENSFASYIGTRHCISLNSGTDALILGTRALGFSEPDEIIFPSNTYYATILAAVANGVKPVLSEVDANDFGYDISALKKKITARTKAIMVVHLYGQSDKICEIQSLIKKNRKKDSHYRGCLSGSWSKIRHETGWRIWHLRCIFVLSK